MKNSNRVMIIEDEAIIALGLKKQLTDLGYSVQSIVSSGKEALDLMSVIEPDLVFVDINLPGEFNGFETARTIHRLYDIPMIICTGCERKEVKFKTTGCGVCGYLFKPYDEREVKKEINSVISRHAAISH